MRVLIWGAGHYFELVLQSLNNTCEVLGIIDNNKLLHGKYIRDKYLVISPLDISQYEFDRIVVSVQKDNAIEQECLKLNIPKEKVIFYWREPYVVFDNRLLQMQKKIEIMEARLDSAPYELHVLPTPKIHTAKECLSKIIKEKKSLCRFGDGEFELMRGNNGNWFQNKNIEIQHRLLEIIRSNEENIICGIAQNFYDLDQYTDEAADEIRMYMKGKVRMDILNFLSFNNEYYDAYVSRPYILYKSKENAEQIFIMFKDIWKNRKVFVVEGTYGRMGINNDLFETALEVHRIVCPGENAYEKYDEIIKAIEKNTTSDDLILISLGATATVLAYDLAKSGRQALDIGQLDNEYDWYLNNARDRERIEGKMVAEVGREERYSYVYSKEYEDEIIEKII